MHGTEPDDDAMARTCLELLRSGTNAEKCNARIVPADIFERRGQYTEAVALLEKNREWGWETIEGHEALARLYSLLGRPSPANKAARRADRLRQEIQDPGRAVRRMYWIALGAIVCGVVGTIGSFFMAALQGGGRYTIFYEMVIVGTITLVRLAASDRRR